LDGLRRGSSSPIDWTHSVFGIGQTVTPYKTRSRTCRATRCCLSVRYWTRAHWSVGEPVRWKSF